MDRNLEEISTDMVKRYSDRYQKLGYNVRTLGWGTEEQQRYRFEQTLDSNLNLEGKNILDIGCGFGDYYKYLIDHNISFNTYAGYDLNDDLISEAKKKYASDSRSSFDTLNILESAFEKPLADVGIMLGVLNLNLQGKVDNYEYSAKAITNAFTSVEECLVVDFLSDSLEESYPAEDFVFYHNPSNMLEMVMSLTSNVVLKHNYLPIPQKEFMLFIYK